MSTSQEKVLEMVARGELSAAQADSLLGAMQHRRSRLRVLLHPLEAMSTERALIAGAAAALGCVALAPFGVHFDGALDLHVSGKAAPFAFAAAEVAAWWLLPALVFFLGTRVLARHTRLRDFVAAVGVAHVPYALSALPLLAVGLPGAADPLRYVHDHPARVALTAIVGLCALAWLLALLYTGVKTASGLTGRRLLIAFVVLLFVAEAASKLALFGLAGAA